MIFNFHGVDVIKLMCRTYCMCVLQLQQTNGGGSIKKVSHEFGSVDRRKKVAPAPSSSSTKLRMTHSEQHIPVVVVAPMKTANKPPHEVITFRMYSYVTALYRDLNTTASHR